MGGRPLALGIAKLLAIALLTPLVLDPRRWGYTYARGFEFIGHGPRILANRVFQGGYPRLRRRRVPAAAPPSPAGVPDASTVATGRPSTGQPSGEAPATEPAISPGESLILQELVSTGAGPDVLAAEGWRWLLPSIGLLTESKMTALSDELDKILKTR